MNRRSFLAALSAAFVADPERLLWRPGAKLISVPKPRVKPFRIPVQISRSDCFGGFELPDPPPFPGYKNMSLLDEFEKIHRFRELMIAKGFTVPATLPTASPRA